jgi:hypothetical protein
MRRRAVFASELTQTPRFCAAGIVVSRRPHEARRGKQQD